MSIHEPSCVSAFNEVLKDATDAESATDNATANMPISRKPASIKELRTQLRAQLERNSGTIPEIDKPAQLRTELRTSDGVVVVAEQQSALGAEPQFDITIETRRQRVVAMLAENPTARYVVVTDTKSDPDAVIVALGIRGKASCEMHIPRDKYDGVLLLDLIEQHGRTEH